MTFRSAWDSNYDIQPWGIRFVELERIVKAVPGCEYSLIASL